jgi:sugar phosphate isomerase/epimerase
VIGDSAALLIGVFARTFPGTIPEDVFRTVASAHIQRVQFNLSSAGLETVPASVGADVEADIARWSAHYRITIDALSGTGNLAHPHRANREEVVRRLTHLAAMCARLSIPTLTLSTGTRSLTDLWCAHPDNRSIGAQHDLRESLAALLTATESTGVTLAFEPEASNVIQTADQAADLIAELHNSRLGVVFDLANLVTDTSPIAQAHTLRHAAECLRGHIALVHAKDIDAAHTAVAPGTGTINFPQYLSVLHQVAGYVGPVIMHGFAATDVASALAHLRSARSAALARPGPSK